MHDARREAAVEKVPRLNGLAIRWQDCQRGTHACFVSLCTMNVRMPFLTPQSRAFLQAVSQLAYANPFLPERVQFERAALGDAFVPSEPVWSQHVQHPEQPRANVWRIVERLEPLAEQLQACLRDRAEARPADLVLYEDAVLHLLYPRYYRHFFAATFGAVTAQSDPAR